MCFTFHAREFTKAIRYIVRSNDTDHSAAGVIERGHNNECFAMKHTHTKASYHAEKSAHIKTVCISPVTIDQ